ncbi:MAG: thiol-disulfide isomerase/thioredoxin [Bacteroidia bacterium]|jgi:thiol-disulfide isomerase/thioredoxin
MNMYKISICAFFIFITICSCSKEKEKDPWNGLWKVELVLETDSVKLPFFLEIVSSDSGYKVAVWNGNEIIVHNDVQFSGDSMVLISPYFNSVLRGKRIKNKIYGAYEDLSRESYSIKFVAKYNISERFGFNGGLTNDVDGIWETWFGSNAEGYRAIGIFETDSNSTKGTFLTETGDYRFLDGGFGGNQLKLSTFDGAHAFLFMADLDGDTLRGRFYSGKHYSDTFKAWRNVDAKLQSPYELSELVNPNAPIDFAFKNLTNQVVSLQDEKYKNKPVLVQLMGSWCPNCLDESVYLSAQYDQLQAQGIEVVALTFEKASFKDAKPVLSKLKHNIEIPYEVLYAGVANKDSAQISIPWLSEIKAYPTLLYLRADHTVYKIHTGFYGPGTGKYFRVQDVEMKEDFRLLGSM